MKFRPVSKRFVYDALSKFESFPFINLSSHRARSMHSSLNIHCIFILLVKVNILFHSLKLLLITYLYVPVIERLNWVLRELHQRNSESRSYRVDQPRMIFQIYL